MSLRWWWTTPCALSIRRRRRTKVSLRLACKAMKRQQHKGAAKVRLQPLQGKSSGVSGAAGKSSSLPCHCR